MPSILETSSRLSLWVMVTALVVRDSRSVCAMALASRKSRMDLILCKSEPGVSGGCVADPVARAKGRPTRLRYVHRSREGCNRQVVSTVPIFGPRTVFCQLICRITDSKAFLERGEIAMEMEREDGLLFISHVD